MRDRNIGTNWVSLIKKYTAFLIRQRLHQTFVHQTICQAQAESAGWAPLPVAVLFELLSLQNECESIQGYPRLQGCVREHYTIDPDGAIVFHLDPGKLQHPAQKTKLIPGINHSHILPMVYDMRQQCLVPFKHGYTIPDEQVVQFCWWDSIKKHTLSNCGSANTHP